MADMGWTSYFTEQERAAHETCMAHRRKYGLIQEDFGETDCSDCDGEATCPLGKKQGQRETKLELECKWMNTTGKDHGLCMSLNSMRPCITFDGNGTQVNICEHLTLKSGAGMRNKSNLKTSDERSISQKIHDSQLSQAEQYRDESTDPIEKAVWENRVIELKKESNL